MATKDTFDYPKVKNFTLDLQKRRLVMMGEILFSGDDSSGMT